jgi:hypothetical protein
MQFMGNTGKLPGTSRRQLLNKYAHGRSQSGKKFLLLAQGGLSGQMQASRQAGKAGKPTGGKRV